MRPANRAGGVRLVELPRNARQLPVSGGNRALVLRAAQGCLSSAQNALILGVFRRGVPRNKCMFATFVSGKARAAVLTGCGNCGLIAGFNCGHGFLLVQMAHCGPASVRWLVWQACGFRRRINQRPHPLPAAIAGHLRPLSWADPHVQAFRSLANRRDGRLASLAWGVAGALLGHGAVKLAV